MQECKVVQKNLKDFTDLNFQVRFNLVFEHNFLAI